MEHLKPPSPVIPITSAHDMTLTPQQITFTWQSNLHKRRNERFQNRRTTDIVMHLRVTILIQFYMLAWLTDTSMQARNRLNTNALY